MSSRESKKLHLTEEVINPWTCYNLCERVKMRSFAGVRNPLLLMTHHCWPGCSAWSPSTPSKGGQREARCTNRSSSILSSHFLNTPNPNFEQTLQGMSDEFTTVFIRIFLQLLCSKFNWWPMGDVTVQVSRKRQNWSFPLCPEDKSTSLSSWHISSYSRGQIWMTVMKTELSTWSWR